MAVRKIAAALLAALAACEPGLVNPLDPSRGTAHNTGPMLAALADVTVREGERLHVAFAPYDEQGDALTLTASGLPSGAAFDPATGLLTFTPASGQAGDYRLTFAASDGREAASVSSSLTVLPSGAEALRLYVDAGDDQVGAFGAELPEPLTVRVVGSAPTSNQRVRFTVESGDGRLGSGGPIDDDLTDATGRAGSRLTLGSNCEYAVSATLISTGERVSLRARGGTGAQELRCNRRDDDCSAATLDDPDGDGDLYGFCSDCDDADALVHPGVTPMCSAAPAADADGDGHAARSWGGADCDDSEAAIHPGADEVCDAVDQDCDGDPLRVDLDDDGVVDVDCGGSDCVDNGAQLCALYGPAGLALFDPCDAFSFPAQLISPLASERCDRVDNDCDGNVDDRDADGDGSVDVACGGDDCNDANAALHPAAFEVCDGLDNDCDGALDADDAGADVDGDDDGWAAILCGGPDCNDRDAAVSPSAVERCDGRDDNCDGATDDVDDDGDGYITTACGRDDCVDDWQQFCALYDALFSPCDASVDFDFAGIHPSATEHCNRVDDDCDGTIDGALLDGDADGEAGVGCGGADCNDSDRDVASTHSEWCDAKDNDCDAAIDEVIDGDADGVSGIFCGGFDCNDNDAAISPLAAEVCDGVDNDCDSLADENADGDDDGYAGLACGGTDCNDASPYAYPGAIDICDGIDSDCDPATPEIPDGDGDGQAGVACGGADCNDGEASIRPGQSEICFDALDQDCDRLLDCGDAAGCPDNGGAGANGGFDTGGMSGWNEAGQVTAAATFSGIAAPAGGFMAVLRTDGAAIDGELSGMKDCATSIPANRKYLAIDVQLLTRETPGSQLCDDALTVLVDTPIGTKTETLRVATATFLDAGNVAGGLSATYYETGFVTLVFNIQQFQGQSIAVTLMVEDNGPCANESVALVDNVRLVTVLN